MIRFSPRVSALAAVVILTPAMAGCGINAIPTKEEAAKAKWADVQSAYQRRADLVPQLVATVQGAAISERATLTQVIEARAQATGATITPETLNDPAAFQRYQAAQGQLSQALSRMLLVVERYPEIRSNQNSSCCSRNWKGQRTASSSPGATTMRPCGTTTPRCAPSRR